MCDVGIARQIERSREFLFGPSGKPPSPEACTRYTLPPGLKVVPCHEDTNGEWVPDQQQTETDAAMHTEEPPPVV